MYEEEVSKFQRIIDDSGNIVFFGGAGGDHGEHIPDFRCRRASYRQQHNSRTDRVSFFVTGREDFMNL